ncbi:MAG: NAD(P)H-hydrate epimerase [Candidatus Dormibacteraeota bacterium]|nr:NAD(P)H-hydrate epimerase [Candidatus Dormibacteraeota bacterium]
MDKLTSWEMGLTPNQMREVDRLAEAEYGIAPVQLMEIAGLQTARVAREILGPALAGRAVCILTGKGNNGGDGMVAARRMAGWGASTTVVTSFPAVEVSGLAAAQLGAAQAAGVEATEWSGRLPAADLYIDALLGSGVVGAPRARVAGIIQALAPAATPVLALDIPSGLDAETGEAPGDCVTAAVTITLGAPKTGLLSPAARRWVGRLLVADIGIPPALLRRVGVEPAGLFATAERQELAPRGTA